MKVRIKIERRQTLEGNGLCDGLYHRIWVKKDEWEEIGDVASLRPDVLKPILQDLLEIEFNLKFASVRKSKQTNNHAFYKAVLI